MQPAIATVIAVEKDTTSVGTAGGRWRATTSRQALRQVPVSATQVQPLMSPGRGWITSRTPTKPRPTAVQRRQRTSSLRTRTASTVRMSGIERLTAVAIAKGIWNSAIR